MEITRKQTIETLYDLAEICVGQDIKLTERDISALRFAISSLKTDEAYQLEYEGREVKEIVHAKWLMPDDTYDSKTYRKCSNCNVHFQIFSRYTPSYPSNYSGNNTYYYKMKMHYCPNCGAKMTEVEENKR